MSRAIKKNNVFIFFLTAKVSTASKFEWGWGSGLRGNATKKTFLRLLLYKSLHLFPTRV